ncbi:S1C family serine protease [Terricaulis silvestris]|uniref:Putative periplasmic serine endoprotease DegP-like n=1 Tax=Terricaulis silvestris TaxID=2686094 RepID=A0A6I6MKG8_9CAUL|nr:S1C family serine protease [Terricaulis silvestris]QGZ93708.1 putative periplasmic serine endoprotease DegP-like precursor [Terricaulis silvestris]
MADQLQLSVFSDVLATLVAEAGAAVVSVHSKHTRGSGFVWKDGLVITSDESLGEGDISVQSADGVAKPATLVGRDASTNIALLRTDTGNAAPTRFTAKLPRVGALAVAIGARDGAALPALGMIAVSGPAWRSLRGGAIDARLELDVSIRREAEGGLVVDAEGAALGMAAIGPRRRTLLIPAETIARIAPILETKGRVPRGYLGLGLRPVRLDATQQTGAIVIHVDADGPGARAGVHQGDIIEAWDGQPVASIGSLLRGLGADSVGQAIVLGLRRGGAQLPVNLTVGERPAA